MDDAKVGDKVPAEIVSPLSIESFERTTVFEAALVAGSNALVSAWKEILPLGTVPVQFILTSVELMRVREPQEEIDGVGTIRIKSLIATDDLNPTPFKVKLGLVVPKVKLEVVEMTGAATVTLILK